MLAHYPALWQKSAAFSKCCRSSGVEHSLGKGEAESSNLSGSTIIITTYQENSIFLSLLHLAGVGGTKKEHAVQNGKNPGTLFTGRSDYPAGQSLSGCCTCTENRSENGNLTAGRDGDYCLPAYGIATDVSGYSPWHSSKLTG